MLMAGALQVASERESTAGNHHTKGCCCCIYGMSGQLSPPGKALPVICITVLALMPSMPEHAEHTTLLFKHSASVMLTSWTIARPLSLPSCAHKICILHGQCSSSRTLSRVSPPSSITKLLIRVPLSVRMLMSHQSCGAVFTALCIGTQAPRNRAPPCSRELRLTKASS